MVDGVGVCSLCAKVCHRDHDVTYAKFGSFFCDCGAKEDDSCQALVRRPSQPEEDHSSSRLRDNSSSRGLSSIDQGLLHHLGFGGTGALAYVPYRGDIDGPDGGFGNGQSSSDEQCERRKNLAKQLEPYLGELLQVTASSDLSSAVVEILNSLLPSVERASKRLSPVGSLQRARRTLHDLHNEIKTIVSSESLMIPTLGSQEGAFENVRMSFTGDQGQTIRQLLSAHVLRRVQRIIDNDTLCSTIF